LYLSRLTNRRSSKRKRYAKHTAVLLMMSLALSGCSLLPVEQEVLQPPLVEPAQEQFDVVKAGKSDIQTALRGTANFVSAAAANLAFKESGGRIKAIPVTQGQEVKAGELVAEIETGDLEYQISLQQINVEKMQLLLSQTIKSDASDTDLQLRKLDLKREQMSLENMMNRLSKSRLYSPISGVVTFVEKMTAGDFVNAYQNIVSVADPSQLQLTYVASDSKELTQVKAGMPVKLKYRGVEYTGKVVQAPSNVPIATDANKAQTNAVTIYMSIDDAPADSKVGDSAEMTIDLQKRHDVIVLPRSAIRSYMNRYYVQIADGERRKEVDVEVGLMTATEVEIVKGVEEGQQVILNN